MQQLNFLNRRLLKSGIAIVIIAIVILAFSSVGGSFHYFHSTIASNNQGRQLGFWVGETDMWGGGGLNWSPQSFVSNYFDTAPYPSTLLFTSSAGYVYPQELNWLNQVLSMTDSTNIKVVLLFFINLSGGTISGRPDQTQSVTTFMNSLRGHPSLYGAEYENEYFGNTLQEETTFNNIVTGAGYLNILNPGPTFEQDFPNANVLDYSTYPYYGGTIPSSLPSGSRSIGVGYGETGPPLCNSSPCPAWTQSSVTAIVNTSPSAQFTFVYSEMGYTSGGQPFNFLWNWQTLRGWIWNDPNYQANYVLSTSQISTSSTSSSSTSAIVSTSTSTTSQTSVTTLSSQSTSSSTTSVSSQSQTSNSTVSSISTAQPAANSQSDSTSSFSSSTAVSSTPQSSALGALRPSSSKETALTYSFASYEIALIGGLPPLAKTIRESGDKGMHAHQWRW